MKVSTRAEHKASVLEVLETLGPSTPSAIQRMTCIASRTVHRLMQDMAEEGLVHADHREKGVYWTLGARQGVAGKSTRFKAEGAYTPPVWNPDVARPGANDFLKVPSLMGTQRVEHRHASNACVSSVRGMF